MFNLQLKYKKDMKMKGSSAYQTLNTDDNLTLKCAQKINKLVSKVSDLCPWSIEEHMDGIFTFAR